LSLFFEQKCIYLCCIAFRGIWGDKPMSEEEEEEWEEDEDLKEDEEW